MIYHYQHTEFEWIKIATVWRVAWKMEYIHYPTMFMNVYQIISKSINRLINKEMTQSTHGVCFNQDYFCIEHCGIMTLLRSWNFLDKNSCITVTGQWMVEEKNHHGTLSHKHPHCHPEFDKYLPATTVALAQKVSPDIDSIFLSYLPVVLLIHCILLSFALVCRKEKCT